MREDSVPEASAVTILANAGFCTKLMGTGALGYSSQASNMRRVEVTTVPKFIDTHPMTPFTADELNSLQNAPKDEFGVTHHDILFNEKENKIFCVLDAPDIKAVHRHHAKAGIKCESVQEVRSTRG